MYFCTMIATIELDKIELWAYHGCYQQEQVVGNLYEVDVKLDVIIDKTVATDNVKDALNYVEVYDIVKEEMVKTQHLVETVANNIAKAIRCKYDESILTRGWIRVAKMAPPVGGKMKDVAVVLTF